MSAQLRVDLDEGVFVVRYEGRPDDAMFDAYIERYTELVHRGVVDDEAEAIAWAKAQLR